MKIEKWNSDQSVLVIAEIGNNHEGSYALAEELIGKAAQAGVQAVKFQTFIPELYVSSVDQAKIAQLKKFQLSFKDFERLSKVAQQEGLIFISTPFDLESAKFLNTIIPAFKIASGDNNFYPLLECVAGFNKPMLISTGVADEAVVGAAVDFVRKVWRAKGFHQELAMLHCVSSYPTSPEKANLRAIERLKRFDVTIGYSDHTIGTTAAVAAVTLGARIIEKHFTVDKNYSSFRDHQMSADPAELKQLVEAVDQVQHMLGSGNIDQAATGNELTGKIRRSIAASRDLSSGTPLSASDLCWVRPGNGIAPGDESRVIGKRLKQPVKLGELILPDNLGE